MELRSYTQHYHIIIEQQFDTLKEWIDEHKHSSYFVLVDSNTAIHCLPKLLERFDEMDFEILEMEAGESSKSLDTAQTLWHQLMEKGADRDSLLINLGGGVVCDMGGFVASTFKRGIDFIHIPTSLLAMVDAAIGGKTGVNFEQYKNQIGTFEHAKLVYVFPPFLETLPVRHLKNGYAEVIKHAVLDRPKHLDEIRKVNWNDWRSFQDIITISIIFKTKVIQSDFEESGSRKQLNFGHTIGHAIESLSLKRDKEPILHGEAIAIGMVIETFLSKKLAKLDGEDAKIIISEILNHFEIYNLKPDTIPNILEYIVHDKKVKEGVPYFALLDQIGEADWNIKVSEDNIREVLDQYIANYCS